MRHVAIKIPEGPDAEPETLRVRAADGTSLGVKVYAPAGPARGTVLVHAATAVPQSYYARFARYLAGRGARVVTYDYRGIGESRPFTLRGFAATMTDWARLDAVAAHHFVRARWPGEPLVLVGHSFGGQLLGLVDEAREARAAMLVGSQLGWVGHWSPLGRARLELTWRLMLPTLIGLAGYLPGWSGIGEDLPAGVAKEWARWCLHPEYLRGEHPDATDRFAAFARPVLLYSFTDDDFAPKPAVKALEAALAGARVDHRRLAPADVESSTSGIGHFGFFRPRCAPLWREAGDWLVAALEARQLPGRQLGTWVTEAEVARQLGIR